MMTPAAASASINRVVASRAFWADIAMTAVAPKDSIVITRISDATPAVVGRSDGTGSDCTPSMFGTTLGSSVGV
ncbi:hypothetical protein [Nocardia fluminea]|uniref:hypothetical protein n=1 Tax=Nocardia fluminea TaxID=134984 RepID=UPI00364A72B5